MKKQKRFFYTRRRRPRAQLLRAYDGVVNMVRNPKPVISGSQALANQVVQKGCTSEPILCGFAPPVSPREEMVSPYTF